ncbi:hypothetical protein AB0L14_06520 [Streptomyces sp. NPDC052727]|uniref:hypothetical protein n=1 Tax=Streptomyces sp. NPDC052727 TaxID=3154854 RepID=UPI003413005D
MSRLADNIEAVQLGTAAELLGHASDTLDDQDAGLEDLQRLARELNRALRDVRGCCVFSGVRPVASATAC